MGSNLCIPFVAAIIERDLNNKRQILVQTRQNAQSVSMYNGTIEFTAGTLDKPFENVYDALAREIKEETGMTLKRIVNDSRTKIYGPQEDDAAFGFKPFCCTQQLKEGRPWIGFIFRCEVEDGEPVEQEGETSNVRWEDAQELKRIFEQTPEKLFTLEVPAWEYYFKETEQHNA
jgi:8-oxo-dGTP pyrophosphatase MutT (NUDIX family)